MHFGRAVGAVQAELLEIAPSLVKQLGNWNPDTQEDRYSTKLPLRALRAMAGHSSERGQFFLPRSAVEVPDVLTKKIFPFIEGKKVSNLY